jgi:uncharacterized protein
MHKVFRYSTLILAVNCLGCFNQPSHLQLIRAIKAGDNRRATITLMDHDLDVNGTDSEGVTPLLQALLSSNKAAYVKLLRKGANPNICDRRGRCVMNQASKEPDTFWLTEAIKHGGDPNVLNIGNSQYPLSTPLFYAVDNATGAQGGWRVAHLDMLINAGANVNHQDEFGATPVLTASKAGNYAAVVKLIEAGAKPQLSDKTGFNALDWFDGRNERMVQDAGQKEWFLKAGGLLVEQGLLEHDAAGGFRKK